MKISINREDILPALSTAASVVEKRQTLPILSNLLIINSKNGLSVTGSDLEVEVNAQTKNVKGDEGAVTLLANKLVDVCRALPSNAQITIEKKGDNAVVRSGNSRFTLKTLSSDDYPSLHSIDFEERFTIPAAKLKRLLDDTAFSMSVHDVRFYLNGVLFDIKDSSLVSVATDGHRMSKSEIALDTTVSEPRRVIVPRKAVQEILRMVSSVEDPKAVVTLEINPKHLRINLGSITLTTSLIDGQFPEYESIIGVDLDKEILVDRQEFISSLSRMAVLADERVHDITLNVSDNLIKLTTRHPEQGDAEDEIICVYDGESVSASFNVNYLLDALKVIDNETAVIKMKDKDSVCTVTDSKRLEAVWLVMPRRV